MKTIAFVIAILVAVLTSGLASAADAPKGFRTLTWGSSTTNGLKKLAGPTSDGTSLFVPKPGRTLAPLLEIAVAEEAYSLTQGKFYSGSVWLDGRQNFDRMKSALARSSGHAAEWRGQGASAALNTSSPRAGDGQRRQSSGPLVEAETTSSLERPE